MITFNTLRPRQNGNHFPTDIFKCIFLNENMWIVIEILLKFVPTGLINNIPVVVQIMAWRRTGDKSLSEPWWLVYWHIYASLGLNELIVAWISNQTQCKSWNCLSKLQASKRRWLHYHAGIKVINVDKSCPRRNYIRSKQKCLYIPNIRYDSPSLFKMIIRDKNKSVQFISSCSNLLDWSAW